MRLQTISAELTERTRGWDRAIEDLVCEIDILPTIGQHPNILGFVGSAAQISEDPLASPTIVLEYMGGGCLEDLLAVKRKNRKTWRPPKATSFSWYAPALVVLSKACGFLLRSCSLFLSLSLSASLTHWRSLALSLSRALSRALLCALALLLSLSFSLSLWLLCRCNPPAANVALVTMRCGVMLVRRSTASQPPRSRVDCKS